MSDAVFEWYYSHDEEDWFALPAASDRWDAINHALDETNTESDFYICRANKKWFPYWSLFDLDDIFTRTIENNPEIWGEDQDEIFSKSPSRDQERDLEQRLIVAFKEWVFDNNIELAEPYYFDEMKDKEFIEIDTLAWVWTHYLGRPLIGEWGHD